MKKTLIMVLALILALGLAANALACTAIYVGANLTQDGYTYFARSEDMSNSMNKVAFVAEAGAHKAGEVYSGCYGFTYTFTHDSYSYTAFSDDNLSGYCPDCGGEHAHTPYQAAGTNEMGVSMSATESLYSLDEIDAVDPYLDEGIEEAEIVTVILSEAATAKEGVDLLLSIYDSVGACGGSGIFIADKNETWYIENCSGTQYVALKLNAGLAFVQPNVSVIGLIDLSDENVIASSKLIETAVNAGTFIGDADKNQIDFTGSYTAYALSTSERMVNGLNYVNGVDSYTSENITPADFTLTNVSEDGSLTALTCAVTPYKAFSNEDFFAYYQVNAIGKTGNLETHIFATTPAMDYAVEWISMNDGQYTVFVPYFPQYTTEMWSGYYVGTDEASFSETQPEEGFSYPATKRVWTSEGPATKEGYVTLPEGWENGYYWTFDALSNYIEYVDAAQKDYVVSELAALQQEFLAVYEANLQSIIDGTATKEAITASQIEMAQKAQEKAYALFLEISK